MEVVLHLKIKLRNLRLKKNMSIRDLENKSGINRSTISRIERGEMSPSVDILCKLCIALNVKLCDMVDCERGRFEDEW